MTDTQKMPTTLIFVFERIDLKDDALYIFITVTCSEK
jgi:hypothetical protein